MGSRSAAVNALCAALLVCSTATHEAAAGEAGQPPHGEILWDGFGVPHVYAPTIPDVVRGFGCAQVQLHAELILRKIATARGRLAEYFGAGSNDTNLTGDIRVRTEGIPARAKSWLHSGGEAQRSLLESFVGGVNDCASRASPAIDSSLAQVLPMLPEDVLAAVQLTIHFTFMPEQSGLPALLAAWQRGQAAPAAAPGVSGSNGWALAPARSASGNAILMGNPHLPWGANQLIPGLDLYQWVEAGLTVGDPHNPALNATGVAFVGAPFLGIGFTDLIGWTHTNNPIKNADLYEVQLTPDGAGYRFGGQTLPLSVTRETIGVRQPDGTVAQQVVPIAATVHGPLVAKRADGKALALRVAGLDAPRVVAQYWGMLVARGLREFVAANRALQMPFFNVIFADRRGEIMYLFGGRQPVRQGGTYADYAGILDGSDPALLWTRTLRWTELPRTVNPPSGFVQNANDPPWTSTFPQAINPADFPAWIAPLPMTLRPQHGASFLLSQDRFTAEDVRAGKMSTLMLLAERLLPDLLAAVDASGDVAAQQAAAILRAWDRTADADSGGGPLFERWYEILLADPATPRSPVFGANYPAFRTEWSADAPLTTPIGLADPAGAVPALAQAASQLAAQFGDAAVPWGAVHRDVLATRDASFQTPAPVADAAQSGVTNVFGPIRVVDSFPGPDGLHRIGFSGDGWVQIVEFAPAGAQAQVLLTYGNASRPGSPHIADQLPMFERKALRPALRERAEVERNTVRREEF